MGWRPSNLKDLAFIKKKIKKLLDNYKKTLLYLNKGFAKDYYVNNGKNVQNAIFIINIFKIKSPLLFNWNHLPEV